MTPKTITNIDAQPKMKITGYIGQSTTELMAEIKRRREMLTYEKPQPRLKIVGEEPGGLIYIDLDDWIER